MKIYVDADALPRVIREVLQKVAEREKIETILVAARAIYLPPSKFMQSVAAGNAFDGADDWIVDHVEAGDLVITADIPLADRSINKEAEVLNPRGEFFTPDNIKNAMAMRELMDELRITGEVSSGPPPFSTKNRETFINALNRFIQKKRK